MTEGPAKQACGSCPYRVDVPSGLWDPSEYVKLPPYDAETMYQPARPFACHQATQRLCAGWVGTHDMDENLAVRIALSDGTLTPEVFEQVLDYVSPIPLFESGQAAHDHGMDRVDDPDFTAQRTIQRLRRKISDPLHPRRTATSERDPHR